MHHIVEGFVFVRVHGLILQLFMCNLSLSISTSAQVALQHKEKALANMSWDLPTYRRFMLHCYAIGSRYRIVDHE